jgi:protein-L-isoaspartate(D-aspartate) O-methyltransferase
MDYASLRANMVRTQIAARQVDNPLVLEAMNTVPRELFVPEAIRFMAYEDGPLPIGEGQTISQPYIVALMTQSAFVGRHSTVLDIGTGSGYAAAIFSRIVSKVYTIERIDSLANNAKNLFKQLGYSNIESTIGDGTSGWPERGPYDAIVVTAGAPVVPEKLLAQVKEDGCIVIPVGDKHGQELIRLRKLPNETFEKEVLDYVRFVPLIGDDGWHVQA